MCPYCGKNNCVMSVVYRNVEAHGNNVFHLPCAHCEKMLCVDVIRTVKVVSITKSVVTRSKSDF